MKRPPFWMGVVAAASLMATGVAAGLSCIAIRDASDQPVGPAAAPAMIAIALAVIGILLLLDALKDRWRCEASEPQPPGPWPTAGMASPFWLGGAIFLAIATIVPLGFIPASAILFTGTAQAFGKRSLLFDVMIGLVIAIILENLFVRLLGLDLGAGLLSLSQ